MTRHQLYAWLFILLPIVYFLSVPISMVDLAIWVLHGNYSINQGIVLKRDLFSVLPTVDLVYPWGICVVYAALFRIGGWVLLSLAHKGVVLAWSAMVYRGFLAPLKNPWAPRNLFFILLSWFGLAGFCVDRPALVAVIPFFFAFLILDREKDLSAKDVGILNLINILWVNIHGSWLLLSAMYFWRLAWGPRKRIYKEGWGLLGLGLGSLLNPFGNQVFPYAFDTIRLSGERGIVEWVRTGTFDLFQSAVFFLLIGILIFGAIGRLKRRPREFRKLLSSPFFLLTLLGFHSLRNTVWVFLSLIPFLARCGVLVSESRSTPRTEPRLKVLNATVAFGVLLLGICFLPVFKPVFQDFLPPEKRSVFDSSAPIQFVGLMSQDPVSGPIFNDFEYGSYLAFAQPRKIFLDTRNVIFSKESFEEYLKILSLGKGWRESFERYHFRFVLLDSKRGRRLSDALEKERWEVVENSSTILLKRPEQIEINKSLPGG